MSPRSSKASPPKPARAADVVVGMYVRSSLDRSGEGLAVERQESEGRALAERLGWRVSPQVYRDNGISASSGRRPAFEQMLVDLEGGTIGGVIAWHPDRLARRPDDLERLIQAVEKRRAKVATVEAGEYDLGTPTGRGVARTVVAWARVEVEHKGQRQRAANRQAAAAGRYPSSGRRHFGYTPGGKLVPSEARAIRTAASDLLAGVSVHELSRRLNATGLTTTAGGPWRPTQVRRLLLSPRLAAQRVHSGIVVADGQWTPILRPDIHLAVTRELGKPERHKAGPPRRYLLSGIAVCGSPNCGLPVYGASDARRGGPTYRCSSRAHIHRAAFPIEDYIEKIVVTRLSRPDAAALLAPETACDEVAALTGELTGLRARSDELAAMFGAGTIDARQLAAGLTANAERQMEIERSLATSSSSPTLTSLVTAADAQSVWRGLGIDAQRAVLRELITIRLLTPGRGARTFHPASVQIEWR